MNENDIFDVEQPTEIITDDNITSSTDFENDNVSVDESTVVYEFPEYTEYSPLPVFVIEEVIPEYASLMLSNTYYGTISDTYLNYFEGIVQKLPYDTHYLVWRSGAYSYSMAYGEDLEMNGNEIVGDCDIVQIYRASEENYSSIWYVSNITDSISIDTTNLFVYSDLGMFPTLERGLGNVEAYTLLFAVGVAFVYCILHDFFDYILNKLGN